MRTTTLYDLVEIIRNKMSDNLFKLCVDHLSEKEKVKYVKNLDWALFSEKEEPEYIKMTILNLFHRYHVKLELINYFAEKTGLDLEFASALDLIQQFLIEHPCDIRLVAKEIDRDLIELDEKLISKLKEHLKNDKSRYEQLKDNISWHPQDVNLCFLSNLSK